MKNFSFFLVFFLFLKIGFWLEEAEWKPQTHGGWRGFLHKPSGV